MLGGEFAVTSSGMVAKALDDDFGHAPPDAGRRKAGCISSFLFSAGDDGGISNCNCFNIPDNASNSTSCTFFPWGKRGGEYRQDHHNRILNTTQQSGSKDIDLSQSKDIV